MDQWASHRKNLYLLGIVVFLTIISFFIFWQFWYKAPTCFDNFKNADETGIDCGGSCSLICSVGTIKPIIRWDPRLFEISPGIWSALIYIENPNVNATATNIPYSFTLYDQNNNILVIREGATVLPSHRTVGIFEGGITIEEGVKPKRAVFEFTDNIVWQKIEETNLDVSITHGPILRLDSVPRIEANVKNNYFKDIFNIELVIAIFDGSDNVIAASRTFVEKLNKNEDTDVFFTWPRPFDLGSKMCEKSSNIMLLLDRSGSMSSLGKNPPQPLTHAKEAAVSFVNQLSIKDMVGVVSFATKSKNPIDFSLTNDFDLAKKAIESVNIESDGTQYTNIYEALYAGWQELISSDAPFEASKIIVLLTDGVATAPTESKGGTEADDIKYAESMALNASLGAKKDDVSIYTIGLGDSINADFLKQIASGDDHYYYAPEALSLATIYKNISSKICKEIPARVEITYKIFGKSI